MIVISPVKERLTGDFLSLFFNSPNMQKRFQEIRSGSTVPHLTCKAVRELQIPTINLQTQQELVAEAQQLGSKLQHLEQHYESRRQTLTDLKQSLLHKAFTGELTADSKAADRSLSEAGV